MLFLHGQQIYKFYNSVRSVYLFNSLILHIYQRLTAGGNLTPAASETLSSDVMHRHKGGKSDYNEEIRLSQDGYYRIQQEKTSQSPDAFLVSHSCFAQFSSRNIPIPESWSAFSQARQTILQTGGHLSGGKHNIDKTRKGLF